MERDTTQRAFCCHCGTSRSFPQLCPAGNGGAMCVDWFQCQQLRDSAKVKWRPNPPPQGFERGHTEVFR